MMSEQTGDLATLMGEESKLFTSLPAITLPALDLTTIIVVLAIQVAFFVGKMEAVQERQLVP